MTTIILTKATPAAKSAKSADVSTERDRRLLLGFLFDNVRYQCDDASYNRITAAKSAAVDAVANSARDGDFLWLDNAILPFAWIATDNTSHQMDASTVIAFGNTAVSFYDAMRRTARALKDRINGGEMIPDVTDDSLWPYL